MQVSSGAPILQMRNGYELIWGDQSKVPVPRFSEEFSEKVNSRGPSEYLE